MSEKMHGNNREEMLVTPHLGLSWRGLRKCPWMWTSEPAGWYSGHSRQCESTQRLPTSEKPPSNAGSWASRFPHPCPLQRIRFSLNPYLHRGRVAQAAGLGFCFYASSYGTLAAPWIPNASGPLAQGAANFFYKGGDSKYFHPCRSSDLCWYCSILQS